MDVASPEMLARAIYRGVLDREADPTGLGTICVAFADQGLHALPAVLDGIVRSPEFAWRWRYSISPEHGLYPGGTDDLIVADCADPLITRVLGDGWHSPEASWVWADGEESLLHIPSPTWGDAAMIFLEIKPLYRGPEYVQRIAVDVNGVCVMEHALSGEQASTLVALLPAGLAASRPLLTVRLRHPDGKRPSDFAPSADDRLLSVQLREVRLERLTTEAADRLAMLEAAIEAPPASSHENATNDEVPQFLAFESLGSNCEFGFFTRHAGVEGISLLRFNGIPLHKLVRGLRTRFADIAQSGRLSIHVVENQPDQGLIGHESLYLMDYHTGHAASELDVPTLVSREAARMRFLARKLIEDLEDGQKIFVLKSDTPLVAGQVVPLLDAMRQLGTGTLLWIDFAGPNHPAGSVDVVEPGLLKGYISRFADLQQGLETIDLDCWAEILHNAWRLRSQAALPGVRPAY